MDESNQAKEAVKDQFARNAEKYVTSDTHAKGDDLALMVEWLQPKSDWLVLDIATGGGHVTKQLAPHAGEVIATDLTREMLQAARKHISQYARNVQYVVADAENLPFLDDTFEVVTCRIAAHHFPNPEQFMQEVSRVVKPEGKFLLIDNVVPADDEIDEFVNRLEKLRDESHVRCCRIEEWTQWAQACGLHLERSRTRKKVFDFPTWVRRTTRSEEQVATVEQHILGGKQHLQEYCGLTLQAGKIASIQIDEWMAVWRKMPPSIVSD